jgi:hypothetical protein
MKLQTIIVLLAIALSVVVPPVLPFIAHGGAASIGTLDVCHSAAPALSSNGEMPCVNECPCRILPSELTSVVGINNPSCKPIVIAFCDERPPEV